MVGNPPSLSSDNWQYSTDPSLEQRLSGPDQEPTDLRHQRAHEH
jgi:hypothetical protein